MCEVTTPPKNQGFKWRPSTQIDQSEADKTMLPSASLTALTCGVFSMYFFLLVILQ